MESVRMKLQEMEERVSILNQANSAVFNGGPQVTDVMSPQPRIKKSPQTRHPLLQNACQGAEQHVALQDDGDAEAYLSLMGSRSKSQTSSGRVSRTLSTNSHVHQSRLRREFVSLGGTMCFIFVTCIMWVTLSGTRSQPISAAPQHLPTANPTRVSYEATHVFTFSEPRSPPLATRHVRAPKPAQATSPPNFPHSSFPPSWPSPSPSPFSPLSSPLRLAPPPDCLPPLPTTPPPLPPALDVVGRINFRFQNLQALSSHTPLLEVGVLIHGWDSSEDSLFKWRPCQPESLQCGFLSDRMSASLVFKGKTNAFSAGGGVILNPKYTHVMCAYGGDGGTRGKTCSPAGLSPTCVPGCSVSSADRPGASGWCDPSSSALKPDDSWCDGLPWRPNDLGDFMSRNLQSSSYNEIMVDGFHWSHHLPQIIEAFMGDFGDPSVIRLRDSFIGTYGLSESDVPIVSFHPENHDQPFRSSRSSLSSVIRPPLQGKLHIDSSLARTADNHALNPNPSNNIVVPNSGDISHLGFGR